MIFDEASPREKIARGIKLLMQPGAVHEIRVPKAGRRGTISGYFNDLDALVEAVLTLDGYVPGIYLTLNPVNPALLARAANRLQDRAQITTSDADIVARHWMLLDFDPLRPSGISSTNEEHGRAIAAACGAWEDLRSVFGNPKAVCDSGNGARLLYPLNLPNDQNSTELIEHMLAGVAAQCSVDDVLVDLTVFNAARITKLYGTMTCKGDSTPDRPHRRSRVLEIVESL